MNSLFQDLKQAREAKQFTLNDVSDATLINVRFLEAIEQGNTDILPQAYVRAFIREYAGFVGLDPVEIMKRYDRERQQVASPPVPEQHPAPEPSPAREESGPPDNINRPQAEPGRPIISKVAFPAILVLALAVIVWNLTRTKTTPEPTEIESISQQSTVVADSTAQPLPDLSHRAVSPGRDSLTLRATVLDSSWVQIFIDNLPPQEYLFRPNRKISWKAKDKFRITVGNAGGIDLTLNQKHLGTMGKRGGVRTIELNRQTLLQK